jgi:transposase
VHAPHTLPGSGSSQYGHRRHHTRYETEPVQNGRVILVSNSPTNGGITEKHLKQLDAAIKEAISANAQLIVKLNILKSIPGISDITAAAVLIEMPELGTMNGKQAACLAGLAPISQQSGRWQGKERIKGGRAFVREHYICPHFAQSVTI